MVQILKERRILVPYNVRTCSDQRCIACLLESSATCSRDEPEVLERKNKEQQVEQVRSRGPPWIHTLCFALHSMSQRFSVAPG